ncbi:MAG: hypothetical protein VKL00_12175 [Synechococcales bacterium]|nr:hypothetical protein [Synechococcales bacterium]
MSTILATFFILMKPMTSSIYGTILQKIGAYLSVFHDIWRTDVGMSVGIGFLFEGKVGFIG